MFKRDINYLRVSVTDRCNLRCRYCMPLEGIKFLPHSQILSLEEIARLVEVSTRVGIRKVRITGGEPLVRKNIVQLIRYIKDIGPVDDIAITTNGILFADMAKELQDAGLNRVNISVDSLVAEKYSYITRGGDLKAAMNAVFKAMELEMFPVKINTVIINGFNDNEVLDFTELAYKYPVHLRFIEFMPVGDLSFFNRDVIISTDEVKQIIEQKYALIEGKKIKGNGPAKYYEIKNGQGTVGFINPMSHQFCGECNRIRMTAEGKLRACLYDRKELDAREHLRNSASDEELVQLFTKLINMKPARHYMQDGWGDSNERKMYQIGG